MSFVIINTIIISVCLSAILLMYLTTLRIDRYINEILKRTNQSLNMNEHYYKCLTKQIKGEECDLTSSTQSLDS